MWARTNQGSGTGNRLIRYSINTGRLAYALGSSRWTSTAWASQALGAAVMDEGSGTGTCFGTVNDPPSATRCSVQLTGHVSLTAGPWGGGRRLQGGAFARRAAARRSGARRSARRERIGGEGKRVRPTGTPRADRSTILLAPR